MSLTLAVGIDDGIAVGIDVGIAVGIDGTEDRVRHP